LGGHNEPRCVQASSRLQHADPTSSRPSSSHPPPTTWLRQVDSSALVEDLAAARRLAELRRDAADAESRHEAVGKKRGALVRERHGRMVRFLGGRG
jgi:hypothetical protein